MANLTRNFISGKMNKMVDERLVPNGEYIDALNVRMGSTEGSEIGVIENTRGNLPLTQLAYNGTPLSGAARCIGAFDDGAIETLYWFVHDPNFTSSPTGKLDMVVSYNDNTNTTTYHLISVNDGGGVNTTLNFDKEYLITGVNKIENLLYFTDNLNQPKQVNVKRNYANPVAGVDGFSEESILVVKKPPVNSPTIVPEATSSQDNFLEDRFICFAYRYRYEDGEYSATSQFSEPSFLPGPFRYSSATALNEGMLNITNQCKITYNSGGPLVKSVDLLFKDMNNSTIKIIEKLDKEELGLADNTDYTYTFNNSKIFTIAPSGEILRLFDNVPRLAQAQTLMGNRLVYGNYVEGYDLKDANGNPTKLEYISTLATEDIGLSEIEAETSSGNYSWDGAQTIPQSVLEIDLTDINLIAGAVINILFRFSHNQWSGTPPFPNETTEEQTVDFTYILPQDFSSVYALATSTDFQEKIGIVTNIQTIANSCNGQTFTDLFNCIIPNELNGLFKYRSGISGPDQPIAIITSPGSDVIGFQLPTMEFVDDPTGVNITQEVYEYYSITTANVEFAEIGDPSSLHSNRGYEIGILYMDEYNRMTTALVSPNNTVHVPCSNSELKNTIDVNIPTAQVAPSWAKRYKFCIKPDKKDYDIIYSNLFFRDPASGADYFLLEGQNSQKVEVGDELIVKTDTQGARNSCTWTTVLEKDAQMADFIEPVDAQGTIIPVPAGTYMKLRANNFSTEVGELPVVAYGEKSNSGSGCRTVDYPVDTEDPNTPGSFIDYTIPAGSRIRIRIDNNRRGNLSSLFGNVPPKHWSVETKFTASQEYPNFKDWFVGDNVASSLEAQATDGGTGVTGPGFNSIDGTFENCGVGNVSSTFRQIGNRYYFSVKSSEGYSGSKKKTTLKVEIEVIRTADTVVFESDPQDAEPDLWYESSVSFGIGPNGEHLGNIQNQNFGTGAPGLVKTAFFNCYAFGNGVESYKINDSLVGKELVLGNRATTTDSKLYGEELRFADLTYSGVYNAETNINRLNEFNLGLSNFKPLEFSFGPVMKLFARETDILVLQEDKISYVLAGKNLLSDAGAGNAIVSTPEVLGTQIARIEEYGISHNPESFAQWGADKYFTDAKRGVVIQLTGSGPNNDSLQVVSTLGMRTWFRDLFNTSFETQKLGGFDPYMNEFVLSSNNQQLPQDVECADCGITTTINITNTEPYELCYNLGNLVGDVEIVYEVVSVSGTFNVSAEYDGSTYTSGNVSTGGKLTFDKSKILEEEANINITSTGSCVLTLTVNCPLAQEIDIILVCLTSDNEAGLFIHNDYRWTDNGFVSPLHSEQVEFGSGASPIVSQYNIISGPQGGGTIPANQAVISIRSNKIGTDDFNFDINADKFRYLRTNTLYQNTPSDIIDLINASNTANPIQGPTQGNTYYQAQFNMPSVAGDKLYMIWDYRNSTPIDLCQGLDATEACCGCEGSGSGGGGSDPDPDPTPLCKRYTVSTRSGTGSGYSYTDCNGIFQEEYIGGASGFDSETFCAQEGTVDPGGNNLSEDGDC